MMGGLARQILPLQLLTNNLFARLYDTDGKGHAAKCILYCELYKTTVSVNSV